MTRHSRYHLDVQAMVPHLFVLQEHLEPDAERMFQEKRESFALGTEIVAAAAELNKTTDPAVRVLLLNLLGAVSSYAIRAYRQACTHKLTGMIGRMFCFLCLHHA